MLDQSKEPDSYALETPRYKLNPIRTAQEVLEMRDGALIKWGLRIFRKLGAIPNDSDLATKLDKNPADIHPDDITLAGLQIYMGNLKALSVGRKRFVGLRGVDIGTILDIMDGAFARATNQAREFGAVTDVIADRFGEIFGLHLLFAKLKEKDTEKNFEILKLDALKVTILSTLVKSLAEIYGVRLSENSDAGMKARRHKLQRWLTMVNAGKVKDVCDEINAFNAEAKEIARERLATIEKYRNQVDQNDIKERLQQVGSSARVEALKLMANTILFKTITTPVLLNQTPSLDNIEEFVKNGEFLRNTLNEILPTSTEYDLEQLLSIVDEIPELLFASADDGEPTEDSRTKYINSLNQLFNRVLETKASVETVN